VKVTPEGLDAKAEEEIINKRQARNIRKRGNSRKSVTG